MTVCAERLVGRTTTHRWHYSATLFAISPSASVNFGHLNSVETLERQQIYVSQIHHSAVSVVVAAAAAAGEAVVVFCGQRTLRERMRKCFSKFFFSLQ